VKAAIDKIPADAGKSSPRMMHSAYFAAAYGVTFIAPQGVSTESEVSAKDVARIISQIRKQRSRRYSWKMSPTTGCSSASAPRAARAIGGTLYSDALTDGRGPAPTYIDMMRHNVQQLSTALMS